MDLIDEFLRRYTKEQDFYDQVGRLAAKTLEPRLDAAGIRCIVTYRAKSIAGLRDKCVKRNAEKKYQNIDQIYADIKDLVGIRVALYFPGERDQVDAILRQTFALKTAPREFPTGEDRPGKKFSGYSALHYLVHLREDDLTDLERRYALARIEVQVASVLMHAWSEVEHDLAYKPLSGTISTDEHAILDQLNGLVLAGEIALERLQAAGQRRVQHNDEFSNHYDLASHLLGHAELMRDAPVTDSGLGRVDLLFQLLERIDLANPEELAPYLESVHGDFESRPLAEQIVDALLNEDPARYGLYRSIRSERSDAPPGPDDRYAELGQFISRWQELERILIDATPNIAPHLTVGHRLKAAVASGAIDEEIVPEIDALRRIRNRVVHGLDSPSPETLNRALKSLDSVLGRIARRAH